MKIHPHLAIQYRVCLNLAKFIFLILSFFIARESYSGTFSPSTSVINLPQSLTIPANTAAGTIVWTSEAISATLRSTNSEAAYFDTIITSSPSVSPYGIPVYETGIAGLGFRLVGDLNTPSVQGIKQFFCTSSSGCNFPEYTWGSTSIRPTEQVTLELVVTGTVSSGSLSLSSQSAKVRYSDTGVAGSVWNIGFSGTTSIVSNSCTVGSYDTSVDLRTVYTQELRSIETTSQSVDFSIGVLCNSTNLTPAITFSGLTDANVNSVFANTYTGDDAAKGVGVQLLYKSKAITPGIAVNLGAATITSENTYTFNARMYQTLNTVSGGRFTAPLTFMLDYTSN